MGCNYSFLLTEKQRISEKLLPHIILTLSEWADQIDINDNPPLNAREAGLLSLYLLQNIKNSYEHKDERIKLLRRYYPSGSCYSEGIY